MHNEDLASVLARVSRTLASERDETVTSVRICELAVELVDGCDHASITLRARRGRLVTVAASSGLCEWLDAEQYGLEEGPVIDALRSGRARHQGNIALETAWARWAPVAEEAGARSALSVPLSTADEVLGTMNMYSHRINAWTPAGLDFALLYATHAAVALDAAKVITGLETALTSRHRIGIAQGILMERHGLSIGQSFTVLQRYASESNTPVSEVAEKVVEGAGTDGAEHDGAAVLVDGARIDGAGADAAPVDGAHADGPSGHRES